MGAALLRLEHARLQHRVVREDLRDLRHQRAVADFDRNRGVFGKVAVQPRDQFSAVFRHLVVEIGAENTTIFDTTIAELLSRARAAIGASMIVRQLAPEFDAFSVHLHTLHFPAGVQNHPEIGRADARFSGVIERNLRGLKRLVAFAAANHVPFLAQRR